jgi:hypothetical protein
MFAQPDLHQQHKLYYLLDPHRTAARSDARDRWEQMGHDKSLQALLNSLLYLPSALRTSHMLFAYWRTGCEILTGLRI